MMPWHCCCELCPGKILLPLQVEGSQLHTSTEGSRSRSTMRRNCGSAGWVRDWWSCCKWWYSEGDCPVMDVFASRIRALF